MRVPLLILATLLAAALAIGLGGVRLSRRERQERIPADRQALRELAEKWQNELARLKETYDGDLVEIADIAREERPWRTQGACRNLSGVCSLARIPAEAKDHPERFTLKHLDADAQGPLPEVWISRNGTADSEVKAKGAFILHTDEIYADEPRSKFAHGWISSSNKDFGVFWAHAGDHPAIMLAVEWKEVQRCTNEYLFEWARGPFSELHEADQQAVVLDANERPVLGAAQSAGQPPDLLIPMQSRLGSWQIVSWDRVIPRTSYSTAGLAATLSISAGLALLGLLVFRHQVRAQRLAEQRVSFVNRVSHELGTPLTNMLLNLDLAVEAVGAKPELARQRLGLVTEEVRRLARLVANVLTFSQKERDLVESKATCCIPDEVVENVVRQFEPALRRKGIIPELRTGAGDGVMIDPDALAQIVGNLLSNVEKYAADGKKVEIETRYENEWLRVTVRDYGPGIPRSERERIFQPFERLSHRVNEGASGTGLGLAIARDLAERMGGRIDLTDSQRAGSQFEVAVPAPRVLAPVARTDQSAA
ncbi:MAG TPA: HAMP domain-containing sensor histidine kinase [Chthoniobacteraceae bacterium]